MSEQTSALSFIDPASRNRISDHLCDTIGAVNVELRDRRRNQIKVRASSVGDWGFISMEGCGNVVVSRDAGLLRTTGYAALTLPLHEVALNHGGGLIYSQCPLAKTILPEEGFSYLCAYIPYDSWEALSGTAIPDDCIIDARQGPGSVVRATMLSLMQEAIEGHGDSSLAVLLPGFLRMTMSSIDTAQSTGTQGEACTPRFVRILRGLQMHYADLELTPRTLARQCGVSERQLYREFSYHGRSFADELRRLRLQAAREMLVQRPDKTMIEIACAAGFSCLSVFSRTFKQKFKQCPRDFRYDHVATYTKTSPT